MITKLFARPAGEGVYRIEAQTIQRVPVPMCTALFLGGQWVPSIDGESHRYLYASGSVRDALHRCVANYLHRHDACPALSIVLPEDSNEF